LVILNHAKLTNGLTHLAITKLDVLNKMNEIQVCTGYKWRGKVFSNLYENIDELMTEGTPVYKNFKGWQKDLSQVEEFKDLPQGSVDYLKFMEDFLEVPIAFISTSPERSSIITTTQGKAYLN
ncbi:MAG TPA: adenylosuccinate synthetase, partial [Bdellovibrionota bacterium]|nr:adenylosuccinate synthetase [Bdellovibrionota bacterium]